MEANCPNCGAPRRGSVCDYCGTPFRAQESFSSCEIPWTLSSSVCRYEVRGGKGSEIIFIIEG